VKTVFSFLADHPGVVKGLAFGIGTLLVAATVAWTASLIANPVGAFTAALVLLVGGIVYSWTHFQTFRDIVIGVFTTITSVQAAAIIGLIHGFQWFGNTVFDVATNVGKYLLAMAMLSDKVFHTHLAGSVQAGLRNMEGFRAGFNGAMDSAVLGVETMRNKVNDALHSLDGRKISFSVTANGQVSAAAFAAGGGAAKLGAAARFGFADGGMLPSSATIQPAMGGRGLVQWAEPSTHGEAFIPLNPAKRERSVGIWQQTGRLLGQFAEGGFTDNASGPIRTGLRIFVREFEAAMAQAAQAGAKSAQAAAAKAGGGGSYGGTPGAAGGAGRWAGTVMQALSMLGQPAAMVAGVLSLINSESGGNPNAINLWDSNAKAGHPSRGLMQTIPGTFEQYRSMALPDNIVDPLANVYAGINYALKNYGPGMLLAGGRHSSGGGYLGYDSGGILPSGRVGINRSGLPERILSPSQTAAFERLVAQLEGSRGMHRLHRGTLHITPVLTAFLAQIGVQIGHHVRAGVAAAMRAHHAHRTHHTAQHHHRTHHTAQHHQAPHRHRHLTHLTQQLTAAMRKHIAAIVTASQATAAAAAAIVATQKQNWTNLASTTAGNVGALGLSDLTAAAMTATNPTTGGQYMLAQATQQMHQRGNFDHLLLALSKRGLNAAMLQQIASMGPDQGMFIAQSLLSGPGIIKGINQQYNMINRLSGAVGANFAIDTYGQYGHPRHYDSGGMMPSGGFGVNRSGRPERILSPGQTASFDRLVKVLEQGGAGSRGPLVGTVHVHDNVGLDLVLRQAQFREHTGYL